jgi:hypothetical protein
MSESVAPTGGPTYSDEQVLEGLRQAAAVHGEPLSASAYDAYFPEHGLVSRSRVVQRWGSWNQACAAAGLAVNATHSGYRSKWSAAAIAEHVADYLADVSKPSYAGYDAWQRDRPGTPSAQTVRNRFGGWKAATLAAEDVLGQRS